MDAFDRPFLGADEPPISSANSNRQAASVAHRRRNRWCEIRVPQEASGGFGEVDDPAKLRGRYRCAIAQSARPSQNNPVGEGAQEILDWEIVLPPHLVIPNSAVIAVPGFLPPWEPNKNYSHGACIRPVGNEVGTVLFYVCDKAGQSGANQPQLPERRNARVLDNTTVWRQVGALSYYEVTGSNPLESNAVELAVRAKEIS